MDLTEKLSPSCQSQTGQDMKSETTDRKSSDSSKPTSTVIPSLKSDDIDWASNLPTTELERFVDSMRFSADAEKAALAEQLSKLAERHTETITDHAEKEIEAKVMAELIKTAKWRDATVKLESRLEKIQDMIQSAQDSASKEIDKAKSEIDEIQSVLEELRKADEEE